MAFRRVLRRPALRRVELAFASCQIANVGLGVGVAVYAYRAGGPSTVALVYVLRLVPAAVVTPFAAVLADTFPRSRVMLGSNALRCALASGVAVAAWADAGHWVIYGLCVVIAVVGTAFRPAQVAVLPSLTERPEELTAANVVSSTIEGLGFFAGPAIAGVLLAVSSTTVVFVFCAVAFGYSTLVLMRPLALLAPDGVGEGRGGASFGHLLLAGMRTILSHGELRILVGLFSAQTIVAGALSVLLVITALQLTHSGSPGVGWLDAAVGVGGVLGSVVAVGLAGRTRLTPPFVVGIVLWGVPFLAVAAWPSFVPALLAFGVIGVGNILARRRRFHASCSVPSRTRRLARVFGALQAICYGCIALGAVIVPPLVRALGARWALVATGAFLPILALLAGPRLLRLDAMTAAPAEAVALLRGLPIFAPLATPLLERVALGLGSREAAADEVVIREGDEGDSYYILASGAAAVSVAGQRVNLLGPGDGFGEIALLRDVRAEPRP